MTALAENFQNKSKSLFTGLAEKVGDITGLTDLVNDFKETVNERGEGIREFWEILNSHDFEAHIQRHVENALKYHDSREDQLNILKESIKRNRQINYEAWRHISMRDMRKALDRYSDQEKAELRAIGKKEQAANNDRQSNATPATLEA